MTLKHDLTNVLTDHKLRKQVGFTIIEAAVFEQINTFKKKPCEIHEILDVSKSTVYNSISKIQQKGYLTTIVENVGYIYLAFDENTGLYKIGFSRKPNLREKTLQSEKPTIKFIICKNGTIKDETKLHRVYKEKKIRGEWYGLTNDDVVEIIKAFNQSKL